MSGIDDVREIVLARRALIDEDYAKTLADMVKDY